MKINEILYQLGVNCDQMTDCVFYLFTQAKRKNSKCIFNLIAECYKDVQSYCVLMNNACWTQAGMVLRLMIEQVSAFIVLIKYPKLRETYIELYEIKQKYKNIDKKHRNDFLMMNNISVKPYKINDYFDYSWIKSMTKNNTYSRDDIIILANLESLINVIKTDFNKFAHGSLSIFEFDGGIVPWKDMKDEGVKMNNIAFKLFILLIDNTKYLISNFDACSLPIKSIYEVIKTYLNGAN